QRRVLPGPHQIVGKKAGFMPRTIEIFVLGGKQEHTSISLEPLSKAARVTHRWSQWIPWATLGGGLAVVGIGGLLHEQASSNLDSFVGNVTTNCVHGCPTAHTDLALRDRAFAENAVGIGVVTAGFATVAAGVVMLYFNRGRVVYEAPI